MGSRGSVIPFFLKEAHKGYLPITDNSMTRFNILLKEGVELVLWAIENAIGSEIFVPKIPSYRITDVAEAILPGGIRKQIGIRPGEKLHEQMIGIEDAPYTFEYSGHFKILPSINEWNKDPNRIANGKKVDENFTYCSDNNSEWMEVSDLKKWIEVNKDKIGKI